MVTDMKKSKLFSPLQLGRTTLKNRVAMAPMSMDYEAADGTVPKKLADIFVRRAEGGTGYVVIDAVTVDSKYPYIGNTTALDKDTKAKRSKLKFIQINPQGNHEARGGPRSIFS